MAKNAIPEEYDLLRTIQMVINGYYEIYNDGIHWTSKNLRSFIAPLFACR